MNMINRMEELLAGGALSESKLLLSTSIGLKEEGFEFLSKDISREGFFIFTEMPF